MRSTPLTPRECEVLGHLAMGMCNKQIAVRCGIEVNTVRCHVRRVLRCLNARNRTEAAIKHLLRADARAPLSPTSRSTE